MHSLNGSAQMEHGQPLGEKLETCLEKAKAHQPENWEREKANLDNEILQQRLRNLGYIE
jgi:hypothetical protein